MKNATRFLMMIGAGVLTSAAIAVPAQAAPSSTPVPVAQVQRDRGWTLEDDYDTRRACNWAGERGEHRNKWDDYKCVERRGDWNLWVREDDHRGHWGNNDDDNDGHGGRGDHRDHDDDGHR